MEHIIITIDPNGNSEIEVKGSDGEKCKELTKPYEDGLGEIENRTLKAEYRNRNRNRTQQQNKLTN